MRRLLEFTLLFVSFFLTNCKKAEAGLANQIKKSNDSINAFIQETDGYDYTKLGIECKNNNLSAVKNLVDKGADINIAKKDELLEYDALFVAIENNHPEIVDFLVKSNANINQVYTEEGLTPLGLATKLNEKEVVEILIKKGANVNGVEILGVDYVEIPLLYAIENNNWILSKILVNSGANLNLKDRTGKTLKNLILEKDERWKDLLNTSHQKQITLRGEYYAENDNFDDYEISLNFVNDSIIYTEIGNMGKTYNQYLLSENMTEDNKIFLKYFKTINGFTGDADKNEIFGTIIFKNEKITFVSDYLDMKYKIKEITMSK